MRATIFLVQAWVLCLVLFIFSVGLFKTAPMWLGQAVFLLFLAFFPVALLDMLGVFRGLFALFRRG